MIEAVAEGAIAGMLSGFGVGVLVFFKKNITKKEVFDPKKLGVSILIFGVVGAILNAVHMDSDAQLLEIMATTFLASYSLQKGSAVVKHVVTPPEVKVTKKKK